MPPSDSAVAEGSRSLTGFWHGSSQRWQQWALSNSIMIVAEKYIFRAAKAAFAEGRFEEARALYDTAVRRMPYDDHKLLANRAAHVAL